MILFRSLHILKVKKPFSRIATNQYIHSIVQSKKLRLVSMSLIKSIVVEAI